MNNTIKDEDIIPPAVNGTKALLEGCKEHGVKKCIITSSMITVQTGDNIKDLYTESDFAPSDGKYLSPYAKSKVFAEKATWEFHKALPEDCPLEIVTIHPGLITGNINLKSLIKRSDHLLNEERFFFCRLAC